MEDTIEPEKADQELVIPEDEEFIELTDVIKGSAELEEEIIELTDVIESSAELEDETIDLADVVVDAFETEDEIVELTDIAEAPGPEFAEPMERIDEEEEAEAIDLTDVVEEEDDMIEASPAVSSEQVDAAIERVVRDMLSEKIESILVQVIEKEVSKEIGRLKGLLMDEPVNEE